MKKQAYQEVVEDGHPILIVSAIDIAGILRKNAINSSNVDEWLKSVDGADKRLLAYCQGLKEIIHKSRGAYDCLMKRKAMIQLTQTA